MQENHDTVFAWLNEAFGPAPSNFRIATRANEELAEAFRAIAADDFRSAQVECADVIIVLCRIAKLRGLDWGHFDIDPPSTPKLDTMVGFVNEANRMMGQLLCCLAVDDNHIEAARLLSRCYRALQGAISHIAPGNNGPAHEITCKMATNRAREWKKRGDGMGYHVRPYKGLKLVGTFLNFPLYVAEGIPDNEFAMINRRLSPDPLPPTPDFIQSIQDQRAARAAMAVNADRDGGSAIDRACHPSNDL